MSIEIQYKQLHEEAVELSMIILNRIEGVSSLYSGAGLRDDLENIKFYLRSLRATVDELLVLDGEKEESYRVKRV